MLDHIRAVLRKQKEQREAEIKRAKAEQRQLAKNIFDAAHSPRHIEENIVKRIKTAAKVAGPSIAGTLANVGTAAGTFALTKDPFLAAKAGVGAGAVVSGSLRAKQGVNLARQAWAKRKKKKGAPYVPPDDIQESIQFYIVSEGVQLSPAARTAIDNAKQAKSPGAITKTIKYFKKKGAEAVKPIRNRLRQSRIKRLERGEAPRFMNPYKRYNASSPTIKAAKRAYRNSKLHAQIKAHKARTRELIHAHNDRIRQINAKIKSAKGNAIKRAELKGRKGVLIANHQTRLGKRDAVLKTKADNLLKKRRETTASGQIARAARKHQAGHVAAGPVAHFIPAREPLLLHPATAGLYPVAKGLEWMRVGAHLAHASNLGDVASKHDTRADRQLSRKKLRRPVLEKKPRRPRKLT